MKFLKGKYNNAKIFTDVVDEESIKQVNSILDLESLKDTQIRMMPDIHAGKGCTIGTTITLKGKVIPNLVGVDIGCGMLTIPLREKEIDLKKLDEVINTYIPSGFNIHDKPRWGDLKYYDFKCPVNKDHAEKSWGTLGGGNHFIEVSKDNQDNLYLVIHTGSRHLGVEVCNYYQELAYQKVRGNSKDDIKNLISSLKEQGREREIAESIKMLKAKTTDIPKELCHLEKEAFDDYIHDMRLAQQYAEGNRRFIAVEIMVQMGLDTRALNDSFETVHNYIDTDKMILRKGAVSAENMELLLIPINMRDGSLICIGKGNPDWNYSAPHGAGRIMSRNQARENITLDDFKESMNGIYSTSVCEETIDESPFAYKSINDIVNNIGDTVDIVRQIKPIYNYKAH